LGAATHGLGTTAVVLEIENEGVLQLPLGSDFVDDAANRLVEGVDLRGIDLHAAALELLVLHVLPLRGGRVFRPAIREESQALHLGAPGFARRFIAAFVAAAVLGDVGGFRVQRPVGGGEGGVEEEGLGRVITPVVAQEAHGLIGDGVGVVVLRGLVLGILGDGDELVVAYQGAGIEVTAGAMDGAVVAVEAALEGPVAAVPQGFGVLARGHVPFTDGVIPVTGGSESLGEGHALAVQAAPVAVVIPVLHHVTDAGLVRVETGEQRGAGRAASRGVVKLGEPEPVGRQGIQVRCGDFAPVTTDVGVAHVIGENHHQIGPGCGRRLARQQEETGKSGQRGAVEKTDECANSDAVREARGAGEMGRDHGGRTKWSATDVHTSVGFRR
jgi:hypothetical protein